MDKTIYKTKDLAEASALIVNKVPLLKIERESVICWFVFGNEQDCQIISNKFFFGELLVNARQYHEAMSRLKNRIFSR